MTGRRKWFRQRTAPQKRAPDAKTMICQTPCMWVHILPRRADTNQPRDRAQHVGRTSDLVAAELAELDSLKGAHGGVKNEKFAEIVLIYAGSERSELASDSAKLMQFIAAVFDAFLRSRPWFCPRKPRACQPVAGVAGCSVASGDLCCRFQAPLCSMMSPLCLAGPLPLRISLHQLLLLLSPASPSCSGPCSRCSLVAQRGGITAPKCSRTTSRKRSCVMVPLYSPR